MVSFLKNELVHNTPNNDPLKIHDALDKHYKKDTAIAYANTVVNLQLDTLDKTSVHSVFAYL
jgi:hypothetical protein